MVDGSSKIVLFGKRICRITKFFDRGLDRAGLVAQWVRTYLSSEMCEGGDFKCQMTNLNYASPIKERNVKGKLPEPRERGWLLE